MNTAANDELAERIKSALRGVIDPELGYNVLDLGLIYDVSVENSGIARITMTTTTRGCPATNFLQEGVRETASHVAGVKSLDVDLTYDPPWTPQMMSAEAKQILGIG
ncbi:MAG TPA: metal-sulfur cluster assembly factor [Pseudolabrys sp.]|jgi:metal-sulfur cluster biosynthetic enzyme|nr:metal-sulfur cluster assembly factor [Pseudolabrys sp.]HVU21848.1 metal-sulfur cluster assembly factor [Rhizomicrobium sp.]